VLFLLKTIYGIYYSSRRPWTYFLLCYLYYFINYTLNFSLGFHWVTPLGKLFLDYRQISVLSIFRIKELLLRFIFLNFLNFILFWVQIYSVLISVETIDLFINCRFSPNHLAVITQ